MRPGYLAGRDPDGTLLAEHRGKVQAALAGTGALVIDAHAALEMPEDAFFDAYHLKQDLLPQRADHHAHRPSGTHPAVAHRRAR